MSVDVVGIFVGGSSRRMGGFPKGLLSTGPPGNLSIVERTLRLAERIAPEVVLIGTREEYARLGSP